jgi:hypothetical protein
MAINNFDPTKYGAVPINESFDPVKLGAVPFKSDVSGMGTFFPASATDNPIQAGLKAAGNVPSSAFNLGKSIYSAVRHPVQTVKGIGEVALGGAEKLIPGQQGNEEAFNQFTNILKERYGSLENLQKTATNDPFGFGTDVLGLVTGGATLVGKGAAVTGAIGKVGKLATSPVAKTIEKTGELAGKTTKFGISQVTGLNPETITELIKNPQAFKNVSPEIRVETANAVKDALDVRLGELSDLGKGYESIRTGTNGTPGLVTIPEGTVRGVLNKYGVKLDENNKIITSPESRPLSAGDRLALQDFIDNYGGVTTHTNNSFLNTREALSNLAKYDTTKTNLSTNIARDLRGQYDLAGKSQIPGLTELDSAYAPERQLLGQLKKDIFDAKGELKPNAISKIANINGKGKEKLLERVKEILPDIEQRVKVIKAVEDIERASGFKVGTYTRGIIRGGAMVSGNIPAIVSAILSQPEIAVPLLKGAGYTGQKAAPILNAVKTIVNDVNNFKLPAPLLNKAGESSLGLSVKSITPERVAAKVDATDLKLIKNYLEKDDINSFTEAMPMIQAMGLNAMEEPVLRRFLKEVVDIKNPKVTSSNWSTLQKQKPDLFETGILRKNFKPMGAKEEIPKDVHVAQGNWQNYGQYDEIPARAIYESTRHKYFDADGKKVLDSNGYELEDIWNSDSQEWVEATISNRQLRDALLDKFSSKEGKEYLKKVADALPKNADGTITAYRIGSIGGGPQSYTLSDGMAKTFSNQGTDILPGGTPGLPTEGYKDFGPLNVNEVKIDPKGIVAWSPYDAEILVEPEFVKIKGKPKVSSK